MPEPPHLLPDSPAGLRDLATRLRSLARAYPIGEAADRLRELAAELDAKARSLVHALGQGAEC
jgi:hypothetical protein